MPPPAVCVHGVLLVILNVGVLISGRPGIGKSELGLNLINGGHRLVADDVAEFIRTPAGRVKGRSPELLRDFMSIRGVGVINIRALFGNRALADETILDIILTLDHRQDGPAAEFGHDYGATRTLLGSDIPELSIVPYPGRNLVLLVECLVRNYILHQQGYNAGEDFVARQRRALAPI